MLTIPRVGVINDLLALQQPIFDAQVGTPFSYELLMAQAMQESTWDLEAYRYEPNFDRRYVSGHHARWSGDAAWLPDGPTVEQWFAVHHGRAHERTDGVRYDFIAQTRLSASYGAFQLMYPVAVDLGYRGLPEGLRDPVFSVRYAVKLLGTHYRQARADWDHKSALKIALARYNGGAKGNIAPTQLRNIDYVRAVNKRYVECWGTPLFTF